MLKTIFAGLAALCLATAAVAAPKDAAGEKPCPAGVGKAVCCKASVADHCMYTSCCEQGNKAFFTKKGCGTCAKHTAKAQLAHHGKAACDTKNLYTSCCDQGNKGFFKAASCNTCASSGAKSCCAATK